MIEIDITGVIALILFAVGFIVFTAILWVNIEKDSGCYKDGRPVRIREIKKLYDNTETEMFTEYSLEYKSIFGYWVEIKRRYDLKIINSEYEMLKKGTEGKTLSFSREYKIISSSENK